MRKIRSYLREGWTLTEWCSDEGHAAYWLTSPDDEDVCSFPTKREARAHWDERGSQMRKAYMAARETRAREEVLSTEDEGRHLAEQHHMVWEELDEFERSMWRRVAQSMK